MDDFVFNGIWDIEGIEGSFPGKLTFSAQSGGRLEISFSSLTINKKISEILQADDITISGYSESFFKEHYTCINCKSITQVRLVHKDLPGSTPEIYYEAFGSNYTFIFQYLIEGCYISSVESCNFISCDVIFNQLENWLKYTPYVIDEKGRIQNIEQSEIDITYNTMKITIKKRTIQSDILIPPESIKILASPTITIKFQEEIAIKELIEYINCLNEFFSFVMDECSWISNLSLNTTDSNKHINLYFKQVHVGKSVKQDRFPRFIESNLIKEFIPQIVQKWMGSYSRAPGAFILYFSTYYLYTSLTLEQLFLNLISSYEGFYRDLYSSNNQYVTSAEFKGIKQQIFSAIDSIETTDEFKEKLKSSISYSNQFSLRKMLEDIHTKMYIVDRGWEITPKDISLMRNQYDHGRKELSNVDRKKLYRSCNIIDKLIKYILMTKIFVNLSPDDIEKLIFRSDRF